MTTVRFAAYASRIAHAMLSEADQKLAKVLEIASLAERGDGKYFKTKNTTSNIPCLREVGHNGTEAPVRTPGSREDLVVAHTKRLDDEHLVVVVFLDPDLLEKGRTHLLLTD